MKKRIAFLTSLILFTAIVSGYVYAENTNTQASIRFTANSGPTAPVNPEDPSSPIEPELPPVPGEWVIVFISPFSFGAGTVSPASQFFDIETANPNIQIVDLRGIGAGWDLDASVSEFKNELEQPSLKGAIIHIKNGHLVSQTSMEFAPTAQTDIELWTNGDEKRIITAGKGKGQGLWVNRLYPDNTEDEAYVRLEVPAGAATIGTHTATITWTLSSTP